MLPVVEVETRSKEEYNFFQKRLCELVRNYLQKKNRHNRTAQLKKGENNESVNEKRRSDQERFPLVDGPIVTSGQYLVGFYSIICQSVNAKMDLKK